MSKKFFLFLVVALCCGLFCQAEDLRTAHCNDINSYEVIMEYLSPYIGMNLETMANLLPGIIPNRNCATIYSEDGEYTTGHIGEYFGPVKITWKSNSYPIPLLCGATIGMKRPIVEGLLAPIKESRSTIQSTNEEEATILVVCGRYQSKKVTIQSSNRPCNNRYQKTKRSFKKNVEYYHHKALQRMEVFGEWTWSRYCRKWQIRFNF